MRRFATLGARAAPVEKNAGAEDGAAAMRQLFISAFADEYDISI